MMYRRNTRGRVLLLVFLALSILIITLDFRDATGPLDRVRDVSQAVIAPIQRGLATVTRPVGNFFSSIGDLASLRADNNQLRAEVEGLKTEAAQADSVVTENVELRDLLGLEEPWFAKDKVTAEVISDAPGNYKWAVVIDVGKADGVDEDMAVINAEGLVGKVLSADSNQSTVLLLIDPNFGVASTTEDGKTGSTSGNGEGEDLSLEYVPKDAEVDVGDSIITSSYNRGTFPPGIPVGTVSEKSGDVRAGELELSITSFVDFSDLQVVQVLLETGPATVGSDEKPEDP